MRLLLPIALATALATVALPSAAAATFVCPANEVCFSAEYTDTGQQTCAGVSTYVNGVEHNNAQCIDHFGPCAPSFCPSYEELLCRNPTIGTLCR